MDELKRGPVELKGIVRYKDGNVDKIKLIFVDSENLFFEVECTGELTEEALKQAFPGLIIPERLKGKLK